MYIRGKIGRMNGKVVIEQSSSDSTSFQSAPPAVVPYGALAKFNRDQRREYCRRFGDNEWSDSSSESHWLALLPVSEAFV